MRKKDFNKICWSFLFGMIVLGITTLPNIANAAKFSKGDTVEVCNTIVDGVDKGLSVRDNPAGNVIGKKYSGDIGMILIDTPQDGTLGGIVYKWWKIRHEDGLEGWSAEGYPLPGGVDYLRKKYIEPSTKFSAGERVRVNAGGFTLSVRTDPPELESKGSVNDNSEGTIIDGPFYGVPKGKSGFWHFWKVDYGSIVGWSVQDYLESVQTLSISLGTNPQTGHVPLNTTLTADISGTAMGTINYTFWWNCNDPGTSVDSVTAVCGNPNDPAIGAKFDAINDDPKTVNHTYSSAGSYVAKVIAEQGSAPPAESRVTITATTRIISPSPPRNLRVTDVGDGYVKIAWDPPLDNGGTSLTKYKIYRGTSSGGETYYDETPSPDWTTYDNAANIVNGRTYYYKVTAVNDVGESDFSNEVSATPMASGTIIITSPLEIDPRFVVFGEGETITAQFSITNKGAEPLSLKVVTLGGRDPNGEVVDFDWEENIILNPGSQYHYIGNLILPNAPGIYNFFCTYQTEDGNWNTCIELNPGLTDDDRAKRISVTEILVGPPSEFVFEAAHLSQEDYKELSSIVRKILTHEKSKLDVNDSRISLINQAIVLTYEMESTQWPADDLIREGALTKNQDFWLIKIGGNVASFLAKIIEISLPPGTAEALKRYGFDIAGALFMRDIGFVRMKQSGVGDIVILYRQDTEAGIVSYQGPLGGIFVITPVNSQWVFSPITAIRKELSLPDLQSYSIAYKEGCDISAEIKSPAELQVYDSQGRVTGLVAGVVREEIPTSMYDNTKKTVTILFSLDSFHYDIVGVDKGEYGLAVNSIEKEAATGFSAHDIPTSHNAVHQYSIDWNTLAQGGEGTTLNIDANGDQIFEKSITADDELTQDEYYEKVGIIVAPQKSIPVDTDWKSPTATGKSDNAWSSPINAYSSDDQYTIAEGTYKSQDYCNFNLDIPSNAIINGIEVAIEGRGEIGGSDNIICEISSVSKPDWVGSGWMTLGDGSDAIVVHGGPLDLWRRTWQASEFSNSDFLLRIKTWSNADRLYVDHIRIKVYYEKVIAHYDSIQNAINSTQTNNVIYIRNGTYEGDISAVGKDKLSLIGENAAGTTIRGNLLFKDSSLSVGNLRILYKDGGTVSYPNFKLLSDAGITAINSDITIQDCIIMPNPEIFGERKYGKGIQIWNLYGANPINPIIENNLILNAETGIYLFSQRFGGNIGGEIRNNTLDDNTYGISLRMHSENPIISNNIITRSHNAIHLIYDSLITERLANITNNCFGAGTYDNIHDVWCDAQDSEVIPSEAGNIYVDPEYHSPLTLDYYPQNSSCSDKGFRLE